MKAEPVVVYNADYSKAVAYQARPEKGSGVLGNIICLLFVAVAIGTTIGVVITQLNKNDSDGNSNKNNRLEGLVIPNCTVQTALDFGNTYINLFFAECPDDASYEAFVKAAFQWSSVITNNPFENDPATFPPGLNAQDCGVESDIEFPGSFQYDRLFIVAETVVIDGVGSILGQAGPCLTSGNFPVLGIMQFDQADLADMNADGILEDVILHEMGHVLGIGTLWESAGLLQDPVFTRDNNGNIVTINANNKPKFTGNEGVEELEELTDDSNSFIPVEDGRDEGGNLFFDTPAGQGAGSVDGHWKITDFGTELMVFAIQTGVAHPFSKMTIASLKDFGYTVDVDLGDDYSLPSGTSLRGAAGLSSPLTAEQVKKNVAKETGLYVLEGDINPEWQKNIINIDKESEASRRLTEKRSKRATEQEALKKADIKV